MAVTFATLTIDADSLVGVDPTQPVVATVRTNTDGAVLDDAANKIFLGTASSKGTGTFTFSLPVTNGASNPTDFQYTVDLYYVKILPDGTSKRDTWNSGWFSFTASANLADIAAEQYVPPTWMSTAITTLEGYVADAEAARDAAIAAGLNWRAAWNAATAYAVADAVSYNGSSYRRLVAGTTAGTPAADTTNWGILASKGDTGATGSTGPTGATGATGVQGLPGPGSAAWTASTAVTSGAIRQAPDGTWIVSTSARTTGATFDTTEQGFWDTVSTKSGTLEQRRAFIGDATTAAGTSRKVIRIASEAHPTAPAYFGVSPGATSTGGGYTFQDPQINIGFANEGSEPQNLIIFEQDWWTNNWFDGDSTWHHQAEQHSMFITAAGVQKRVTSWSARYDTGAVDYSISADNLGICTAAGAPMFSFRPNEKTIYIRTEPTLRLGEGDAADWLLSSSIKYDSTDDRYESMGGIEAGMTIGNGEINFYSSSNAGTVAGALAVKKATLSNGNFTVTTDLWGKGRVKFGPDGASWYQSGFNIKTDEGVHFASTIGVGTAPVGTVGVSLKPRAIGHTAVTLEPFSAGQTADLLFAVASSGATKFAILAGGTAISEDSGRGMIFRSPNNHYWRLGVSDAGATTWTDLGTTRPTS